MILVGTLLKFLNQIHPGRWLPLAFTLFFSLLYLSADMVIWHHLLIINMLLALSYIFMFVFSRGGKEFYQYLDYSLYHFYPICLFLIITIYCLMTITFSAQLPQYNRFKRILIIILCMGSLLNAFRTYELNMRGKQAFQLWGQYIQHIETFVQAHKHEPDFSFVINNPERLERWVQIRIGEPSENKEIRGYPSNYLFRKYINKDNPKYYFTFTAGSR